VKKGVNRTDVEAERSKNICVNGGRQSFMREKKTGARPQRLWCWGGGSPTATARASMRQCTGKEEHVPHQKGPILVTKGITVLRQTPPSKKMVQCPNG